MTEAPDFDALRASHNAAIERIAKAAFEQMGGAADDVPTFHWRDHLAACYCACPDGPCEHAFSGWRQFEDERGGEQFCNRCGEGAMAHSLRFLP